jgi:hypothetical protein
MGRVKPTLVDLETKNKKRKQKFAIEHAERILSFENGGGWQLPKDSKYKFDDNGLHLKRAD